MTNAYVLSSQVTSVCEYRPISHSTSHTVKLSKKEKHLVNLDKKAKKENSRSYSLRCGIKTVGGKV